MKCLVISYYFPPSVQIGSRRWGVMAENLIRQGVEVDVLCSNREENQENSTFNEVKGAALYRFNAKLPFFLRNRKVSGLVDKVRYKFSELFGRWSVKGNHYDSSKFSINAIESAIDVRLKEKQYDLVICTVAPLYLAVIAAQKTQKYGVRLWVDYRDPWSISSAYGFSLISKMKYSLEVYNESFVHDIAWKVSMPSHVMMANYSSAFPLVADKLVYLPHGFDNSVKRITRKRQYQTFIYGGTLYEDIDSELDAFDDYLNKNGLNAQFYLLNSSRILSKYSFKSIEVNASVTEAAFYKLIEQFDVFVAIVPEKYKDYISTKYYQLFHMGIPILHIGPKGKLSEFITSNQFGLSFEKEQEISLKELDGLNPNFEVLQRYGQQEIAKGLVKEIWGGKSKSGGELL